MPLCLLFLSTAGCLSLGGKTTYVQDNPEINHRVSALEARVSELEQSLPRNAPETLPISSPQGR